MSSPELTPLLKNKAYDEPSVFRPENLLREARRQNEIEEGTVPSVCLLDPDGDTVATLREDNHLLAALRRLVTTLIPFSYDIVAPDGTELGSVDEQFSLRDRYTIDLVGDIDPRLAVIGTVVVDAIEGN